MKLENSGFILAISWDGNWSDLCECKQMYIDAGKCINFVVEF